MTVPALLRSVGETIGWAVLLLLAWRVEAAAEPPPALDEYFQETWTSADGLPHNLVSDIEQTDEGYLWFATWEGVVRYNGHRFDVLTEQSIPGLSERGVNELELDALGRLLVGTVRGGLVRRDLPYWRLISTDLGNGAPAIYSFANPAGATWIGTAGDGVLSLDGEDRVRRPEPLAALAEAVVYVMRRDAAGTVWIGTDAGLYGWDGSQLLHPQEDAGLPESTVLSLAVEGRRLIVGTDRGVYRWDGERAELLHPELARATTESLLVDRRGDIWIGTAAQGLYRLSARGLEHLDAASGLPNNRVASLYEDRERSLWVGTNAGLFRLRQAPFRSIGRRQGLADDYVRSLYEDAAGRLWVGTSGGLSMVDASGRVDPTLAATLPRNSILSVAGDGADGLWLGTYFDGLLRWGTDGVVRHIDRAQGLPSPQVRALLPEADALWIGTGRGLARMQDERIEVFGREQGLPDSNILSLFREPAGRLWVGTSLGIAVRDPGSSDFRRLQAPELEPVQRIYGFAGDHDGAIWAASDRGLLHFDGSRWRLIGPTEGLPVASVFSVSIDRQGNYWLSSNRGVIRVQREAMQATLADPELALANEMFAEADGMASAQCNGASGTPALIRADGSLWVSTSLGVARVDPERLEQFPRLLPSVVIEQVSIDGQSVPVTQPLQVPPGARRIELEFAGLSFQAPGRIRYRYQLEGFDPAWVVSDRNRLAQFTNLAPGLYRFRGSAANPNGEWSEHEAVLDLEVQPAWWQLTWVRLLAALAAVGLVGLLLSLRLRVLEASQRRLRAEIADATRSLREKAERLHEQNLELDAYAHTVAHDLKTPLTTLVGLARVLDQARGLLQPDMLANSLSRIHATAQKMSAIIDALLLLAQARSDQALKLESVDHERLLVEAQQRLHELASARGAQIRVGLLPPSIGYGPWLEEVWVNYLGNAIKYGGEQPQVEVGASEIEGGRRRYFVRDHGPGLDESARRRLFQPFTRIAEVGGDGHGLGLSIVRRIVERMGGEVGCDSLPGEGSTFWFELPGPPA